jgi:hypothetical protein
MMGSGMLCLSSRSDITAAAAAAVTICKPYSLQTTSGYDSTARACMRAGIFITNDFLNEKRNCRKNDLSVVGEVCPRPEYQCWPVIGYRVSLSSLFFPHFYWVNFCNITQVININIKKLVSQQVIKNWVIIILIM